MAILPWDLTLPAKDIPPTGILANSSSSFFAAMLSFLSVPPVYR
jgi:hypothetical protein